MLLTQQSLFSRLSFSLQVKMLIHEVANKLNKPSFSLWLVSRLARIKNFSLYSNFYFKSVNAGFKLELLTAHEEFNPEKALQGENPTGGISYFDSFLSTTFIGLPFI